MEDDFDCRQFVFDLPEEEAGVAEILVNNARYAGKQLATDRRVPGRIGKPEYFPFWRDTLKASDFILKTISEGYTFPFKSIPPSDFCKNNQSMLKNRDFALQELLRLESLGCIERVNEKPYLCLPLSVVFSKKYRLVVDASRHLNPFLEDRKIKLEDLNVSEQLLKQGDFQTTQDLDSGYWHVPLHKDMRKYVGVHFVKDNGEVLYFVWNVLFLGIKDAVYIFTKLLIPHKTYLRGLGIRVSVYLDDQRILGQPSELCAKNTKIAMDTLDRAGWTVNLKKCSEKPTQSLKFLGLLNDTSVMKYFVPDDKVRDICNLLIDVLKKKKIFIKILAKVLGKVQFCVKAMGPCVRLLTRSSYYLISKASSWNSMIILNDLAFRELSYLKDNFNMLNGNDIRPSLSQIKIDFKISSDASDKGFCVYEVCDGNDILKKRVFSLEESKRSSTERELVAFHDFYNSEKAFKYKGCNIVHYTDNFNCSIILSVGSRNVRLQPIVLETFLAWKKLDLNVTVCHLPRSDPIIEFADFESKNFDLHDFSIDFDNYVILCKKFGPFELDCFASASNKKCIKFYSKFSESKAEGVNFFAQRIPNCNLFVFPPIHLVIPALYHLQKFNSFGCFIVPKWVSAHFWTFLCADGRHFNKFVLSVYIFSPFYVCGDHIINSMFKGVKKFETLAIKFDFSIANAFSSRIDKNFCIFNGCNLCC